MKLRPIILTSDHIDHFWSRVDRRGPNECWPWIGPALKGGYGAYCRMGVSRAASRIAWVVATGEQPEGMVCHRCDNPPCCNPAHLWVGTNRENQLDASRKGRSRKPKTHCRRGHLKAGSNLAEYRSKTGRLMRFCVTCRTARKGM